MQLTPEKFKRIAKELAPLARNGEFKQCPDQLVGSLAEIYGASQFSRSEVKDAPGSTRVLLILESPHKDEFKEGEPVGPANGQTGSNIRVLLKDVIESIGEIDEQSHVVLMNAVQYQCSQGEKPVEYRDAIFIAAWRQGGKADFESRLREIVRDGNVAIVINACTRGNGKDHLRDLVKLVIESVVGAHWRTAHPAAWRYPGRTKAFPQIPDTSTLDSRRDDNVTS